MKKKIFGGIAVLAIAAVAILNVNFVSKTNSMSDVKFSNVEALASESGTPSCTGPKSEATGYCNCTNTNPCKDMYGCN